MGVSVKRNNRKVIVVSVAAPLAAPRILAPLRGKPRRNGLRGSYSLLTTHSTGIPPLVERQAERIGTRVALVSS